MNETEYQELLAFVDALADQLLDLKRFIHANKPKEVESK